MILYVALAISSSSTYARCCSRSLPEKKYNKNYSRTQKNYLKIGREGRTGSELICEPSLASFDNVNHSDNKPGTFREIYQLIKNQ